MNHASSTRGAERGAGLQARPRPENQLIFPNLAAGFVAAAFTEGGVEKGDGRARSPVPPDPSRWRPISGVFCGWWRRLVG